MRNLLYFVFYILIWIYIVPYISDDYQFFFKVFLISLPVLFGYSQIEEIQESFKAKKTSAKSKTPPKSSPKKKNATEKYASTDQIKKKIIGQLTNVQDKSTIALVYADGTLDFIFEKNNKKKKKNDTKNNKKTTNKRKNKKNFVTLNWYNKL